MNLTRCLAASLITMSLAGCCCGRNVVMDPCDPCAQMSCDPCAPMCRQGHGLAWLWPGNWFRGCGRHNCCGCSSGCDMYGGVIDGGCGCGGCGCGGGGYDFDGYGGSGMIMNGMHSSGGCACGQTAPPMMTSPYSPSPTYSPSPMNSNQPIQIPTYTPCIPTNPAPAATGNVE